MLDKDNVTSTNVSEAVEKIPTDEKDYRKCSYSHIIQRVYLLVYLQTARRYFYQDGFTQN